MLSRDRPLPFPLPVRLSHPRHGSRATANPSFRPSGVPRHIASQRRPLHLGSPALRAFNRKATVGHLPRTRGTPSTGTPSPRPRPRVPGTDPLRKPRRSPAMGAGLRRTPFLPPSFSLESGKPIAPLDARADDGETGDEWPGLPPMEGMFSPTCRHPVVFIVRWNPQADLPGRKATRSRWAFPREGLASLSLGLMLS